MTSSSTSSITPHCPRTREALKLRAKSNCQAGVSSIKQGLQSFKAIGDHPQALIATLALLLILSLI